MIAPQEPDGSRLMTMCRLSHGMMQAHCQPGKAQSEKPVSPPLNARVTGHREAHDDENAAQNNDSSHAENQWPGRQAGGCCCRSPWAGARR